MLIRSLRGRDGEFALLAGLTEMEQVVIEEPEKALSSHHGNMAPSSSDVCCCDHFRRQNTVAEGVIVHSKFRLSFHDIPHRLQMAIRHYLRIESAQMGCWWLAILGTSSWQPQMTFQRL